MSGDRDDAGYGVESTEDVFADGTTVTSIDTDDDGEVDVMVVDTLGDGTVDSIFDDADYDGKVDTIHVPGQTLHVDEDTGQLLDVTEGSWLDPVEDDAEASTDLADRRAPQPTREPAPTAEPRATEEPAPTGEPETSGDPESTLAGDPFGDADYWFQQSENGFCAPASVAQVISEFSGGAVSESAVVERGQQLELLTYDPQDPDGHPFDGWSGMTIDATEELLDDFGVPSTTTTGAIPQLETFLRDGRSVLVPVDSTETWTGVDDDGRYGDVGSDHMLVVTGIDEAQGVVYMNDPGIEDGRARVVPLDVFVDAWDDSGNTMIVTDTAPAAATGAMSDEWTVEIAEPIEPADTEVDATLSDDPTGLFDRATSGAVILPMVMSSEAFSAAPLAASA